MPAASVRVPGSVPAVVHSLSWTTSSSVTMTKNIVEPYMSSRSPGRRAPALTASAQASTVPAQTGVPAGMPVASAAASVTLPITSAGQASVGERMCCAIAAARSACQALARRSYIGSHWDAV